jgi:hypothetical protein
VPRWLKLSRRGTVFTAFQSIDGHAWTQVHTPQTVTLPAAVQVGLVGLRTGGAGLAQVTFSHVTVTPVLPAGWTSGDIGLTEAGTTSYEGGPYRLRAAGTDLWAENDAFHFTYRRLTGDGEIVAYLEGLSLPSGSIFTLGGITMRESLADNARHASMIVTTQGKAKFRRRLEPGAATLSDGPPSGTAYPPRWLKVQRAGDRFTAFLSTDGLTWQVVHTAESIVMPPTVYVGLVALRNGGTALAEATFTNVVVR